MAKTKRNVGREILDGLRETSLMLRRLGCCAHVATRGRQESAGAARRCVGCGLALPPDSRGSARLQGCRPSTCHRWY